METSFLLCQEADSDNWHVDLGKTYAGNYTLERLLKDIQQDIDTQNKKFYSRYCVEAHGYRYEDGDMDQEEVDWTIAETCDRWHLTRYEVYQGQGKYEAVIILYYEPADMQSVAPQTQPGSVRR